MAAFAASARRRDLDGGRQRRQDPASGATDYSSGDGGPATAAALRWPQHVGRLPDGALLIAEPQRIRQVSADGTIDTIFQVPEARVNRPGRLHRALRRLDRGAVRDRGGRHRSHREGSSGCGRTTWLRRRPGA